MRQALCPLQMMEHSQIERIERVVGGNYSAYVVEIVPYSVQGDEESIYFRPRDRSGLVALLGAMDSVQWGG